MLSMSGFTETKARTLKAFVMANMTFIKIESGPTVSVLTVVTSPGKS